jgi:hypothetical protein
LRQQHHLLAVIAEVHVVALLADHGDVVAHAAELTVMGDDAGKGIRFIGHQLDVQVPVAVALADKLLQLLDFLRLDGLLGVLPHTVAGFYGFLYSHNIFFDGAKIQFNCMPLALPADQPESSSHVLSDYGSVAG